MLWERMRQRAGNKKAKFLSATHPSMNGGGGGAAAGSKDSSSAAAVWYDEKEEKKGEPLLLPLSASTTSTKGYKRTAAGDSFAAKRNPQPLTLRHDYAVERGTRLEGSLFASITPVVSGPSSAAAASSSAGAANTNYSASYVLPDLVIRTTEIPWSMVSKEFQVLSADDLAFELGGPLMDSLESDDDDDEGDGDDDDDDYDEYLYGDDDQPQSQSQPTTRAEADSETGGVARDDGAKNGSRSLKRRFSISNTESMDDMESQRQKIERSSSIGSNLYKQKGTAAGGANNSSKNNNYRKSAAGSTSASEKRRRRSKSILEVLAPTFKEIVPVTVRSEHD
jgi:hypothetical protein